MVTSTLKGKVALVTGAAGQRGLGRAIALRLAREGADVVVNDLRADVHRGEDWDGLDSVVRELRELGVRSEAIVADVSRAGAVQRMMRGIHEYLGRLDILVNNAAAPPGADRAPLTRLEEAAWDRVIEVNLKSVFLCSRAGARLMRQSDGGGRIVNISSMLGLKGRRFHAAYSASKFAIIGLTESAAQDLAPLGITVNAVCPGYVATERQDRLASVGIRTAPVMVGAADVADLVAYLAAPTSGFLTGLTFPVPPPARA